MAKTFGARVRIQDASTGQGDLFRPVADDETIPGENKEGRLQA